MMLTKRDVMSSSPETRLLNHGIIYQKDKELLNKERDEELRKDCSHTPAINEISRLIAEAKKKGNPFQSNGTCDKDNRIIEEKVGLEEGGSSLIGFGTSRNTNRTHRTFVGTVFNSLFQDATRREASLKKQREE